MKIATGRKAIIITLPHGDLAVVHHDEIANTATVQCHGYSAVLVASDGDVLEQAAQLAAPDERSLETLVWVYGDYVKQPPALDRLRVGEHVFEAYAAQGWSDERSPIMLRDFAHEMWEANKGDATWPEYWDSVQRTVLARALAQTCTHPKEAASCDKPLPCDEHDPTATGQGSSPAGDYY